MLSYVWTFMILSAVITGFFTGKISLVAEAAISGAADGVQLILGMVGIMCFWSGIMEIAQKSGVIRVVSILLKPITRFIFPRLSQNEPAMGAIVMNMAANLLGMGNAATPLGLRAMRLLDEKNSGKKIASHEMCMFVLINTASLQILPTTLLMLRQNAGSQNPSEIVFPVWIVSFVALAVAVICAKIFQKGE